MNPEDPALESLTRYRRWVDIPEHLKTRTQLEQMGFHPGSEPLAYITYGPSRKRTALLYDVAHLTPKRRLSDAQRLGVERAKITRAENAERKRIEVYRVAVDRELAWFHTWAEREDWVVLDTETTGLGDDDQVIEVAVVDANGEPVFHSRCKPSVEISEGARWVHGLSDAALEQAPAWPVLLPQLEAVVAGRTVLAYNAAFDRRLLKQTSRAFNLVLPAWSFDCVMEACAGLVWALESGGRSGTPYWINLDEALELAEVKSSGVLRHGAVGDAGLAWQVVRALSSMSSSDLLG